MKSIQEDTPESQQQAVEIFRRHGGVLRTMQAVRLGVHPRTLYAMRDNGTLEQLSRGLYRLADLPPLGTPDLVVPFDEPYFVADSVEDQYQTIFVRLSEEDLPEDRWIQAMEFRPGSEAVTEQFPKIFAGQYASEITALLLRRPEAVSA